MFNVNLKTRSEISKNALRDSLIMGCIHHVSLRSSSQGILPPCSYRKLFTHTHQKEGKQSDAALKLGLKINIHLSHQQKAREEQTNKQTCPEGHLCLTLTHWISQDSSGY